MLSALIFLGKFIVVFFCVVMLLAFVAEAVDNGGEEE